MTEEGKRDERREFYDMLIRDFGGVTTWAEFYAKMRERFKVYQKCHCPMHSATALFSFYAFILALEELPEEGDISKIVEKMAQLLAYKSDEEFGFTMIAQSAVRGTQGLAALAQAIGLVGGDKPADEAHEAELVAEPKKHLH